MLSRIAVPRLLGPGSTGARFGSREQCRKERFPYAGTMGNAMIDIHAHILPGLDDGAETIDEAVAMVRMAAASGTTDIVATPHANYEFTYEPDTVNQRIRELDQACGHAIRIHGGCDFHLSAANILDALEHPAKYTINGNGYLLVEFPDLVIAPTMEGVFSQLREVGMTPIVTHPERNPALQRQTARLAAWVDSGCLVQVTAQSFLGYFGKQAARFANELMERRLVHFVASDGHDPKHRPPVLRGAYELIAGKYGGGIAEALFVKNPAAALIGGPTA
jgi:protein-tyrosine phosphatase